MRIPVMFKRALASTALLAIAAAAHAQPGPGNPPASAMPSSPPMDHSPMHCPMMGMGPGMMGHGMGGFHGGGMMSGGEMGHMFLHGLNLNEEQQDRIFNILHRQAPRKRESMKLLNKSIAALHELARSSNYSDANVQSFARAVGQASADLALMHAQTERQIYEILTPEQRRLFDERMSSLRHRPGCGMPGTMPMPRR